MENYEYIGDLGSGSYGFVWKCTQRSSGRTVAVKGFKLAHTDKKFLDQAIREVRMLRAACDHPNVVQLLEAFRSSSGRVYMVFEYIDKCLSAELHKRFTCGLPAAQTRLVLWQLLSAVAHLHAKKIIHRDIKPGNLLITAQGVVKLCDFGFARMTRGPPYQADRFSSYVVTRWYRSPEMLVSDLYSGASDIWSLGCTFAELATGRPLFPGTSSLDQLWRIMRCLGPLPPSQAERFAAAATAAGLPEPPPPPPRGKSLWQRLPELETRLLDVVQACLRLDPAQRPTAAQLMQMPYFWDIPKQIAGTALEPLYDRIDPEGAGLRSGLNRPGSGRPQQLSAGPRPTASTAAAGAGATAPAAGPNALATGGASDAARNLTVSVLSAEDMLLSPRNSTRAGAAAAGAVGSSEVPPPTPTAPDGGRSSKRQPSVLLSSVAATLLGELPPPPGGGGGGSVPLVPVLQEVELGPAEAQRRVTAVAPPAAATEAAARPPGPARPSKAEGATAEAARTAQEAAEAAKPPSAADAASATGAGARAEAATAASAAVPAPQPPPTAAQAAATPAATAATEPEHMPSAFRTAAPVSPSTSVPAAAAAAAASQPPPPPATAAAAAPPAVPATAAPTGPAVPPAAAPVAPAATPAAAAHTRSRSDIDLEDEEAPPRKAERRAPPAAPPGAATRTDSPSMGLRPRIGLLDDEPHSEDEGVISDDDELMEYFAKKGPAPSGPAAALKARRPAPSPALAAAGAAGAPTRSLTGHPSDPAASAAAAGLRGSTGGTGMGVLGPTPPPGVRQVSANAAGGAAAAPGGRRVAAMVLGANTGGVGGGAGEGAAAVAAAALRISAVPKRATVGSYLPQPHLGAEPLPAVAAAGGAAGTAAAAAGQGPVASVEVLNAAAAAHRRPTDGSVSAEMPASAGLPSARAIAAASSSVGGAVRVTGGAANGGSAGRLPVLVHPPYPTSTGITASALGSVGSAAMQVPGAVVHGYGRQSLQHGGYISSGAHGAAAHFGSSYGNAMGTGRALSRQGSTVFNQLMYDALPEIGTPGGAPEVPTATPRARRAGMSGFTPCRTAAQRAAAEGTNPAQAMAAVMGEQLGMPPGPSMSVAYSPIALARHDDLLSPSEQDGAAHHYTTLGGRTAAASAGRVGATTTGAGAAAAAAAAARVHRRQASLHLQYHGPGGSGPPPPFLAGTGSGPAPTPGAAGPVVVASDTGMLLGSSAPAIGGHYRYYRGLPDPAAAGGVLSPGAGSNPGSGSLPTPRALPGRLPATAGVAIPTPSPPPSATRHTQPLTPATRSRLASGALPPIDDVGSNGDTSDALHMTSGDDLRLPATPEVEGGAAGPWNPGVTSPGLMAIHAALGHTHGPLHYHPHGPNGHPGVGVGAGGGAYLPPPPAARRIGRYASSSVIDSLPEDHEVVHMTGDDWRVGMGLAATPHSMGAGGSLGQLDLGPGGGGGVGGVAAHGEGRSGSAEALGALRPFSGEWQGLPPPGNGALLPSGSGRGGGLMLSPRGPAVPAVRPNSGTRSPRTSSSRRNSGSPSPAQANSPGAQGTGSPRGRLGLGLGHNFGRYASGEGSGHGAAGAASGSPVRTSTPLAGGAWGPFGPGGGCGAGEAGQKGAAAARASEEGSGGGKVSKWPRAKALFEKLRGLKGGGKKRKD
ncbi:hypothetical protein HYH03_002593 [Edaphochlamys debaryana]|uniref:cyclin-dependent kinase n=1 Tax=Edaphochlamys debaryana TaxID=47281 RepID=A0A835YJC6_9CHLO|nr:hypothetical protein HYH03_002593 [Edaphochlamys debaryana]|eukprot:KAG2499655.1 hypothetical protein HYH03_002593 [Edaphochlamys debaryana]